MKKIIIITGASSGFGALTARALAKAGHTVYASIRETKGRNAPQVEEAPLNWTLRRRHQLMLLFKRLSPTTKDWMS